MHRSRRRSWPGLLLALPLLASADEPAPDRVTLANGRVLEGLVVFADEDTVVLRVKSRLKEFDREDVASVQAARDELPKALDIVAVAAGGNAAAHLAAAERLALMNLSREAQLLYWRTLALDPGNEAAHTALGHKGRKDGWLVQAEGRWIDFDDIKQKRREFKSAWELETSHFQVRTNLELRDAVDAAFDLERVYSGFFAAFGAAWRLHELTEPMEAWIHADGSYLPPASRRGGYFLPGDNRLVVDASFGLDLRVLVHEATHQLLYNTAQRTKSRKGDIPPWLDEGLATYMAAGWTGELGRLVVRAGGTDRDAFALQARSERPYRLNRVLNFGAGDFESPTKVGLKYSQAYALVYFCLHADSEAIRDGFRAFVRGAYEGKSSSTHFKKALGVKERDLEEQWTRFVETVAGGG